MVIGGAPARASVCFAVPVQLCQLKTAPKKPLLTAITLLLHLGLVGKKNRASFLFDGVCMLDELALRLTLQGRMRCWNSGTAIRLGRTRSVFHSLVASSIFVKIESGQCLKQAVRIAGGISVMFRSNHRMLYCRFSPKIVVQPLMQFFFSRSRHTSGKLYPPALPGQSITALQ